MRRQAFLLLAFPLAIGVTACGTDPTDPPAPVCGNGKLETGEVCDDGNTVPGDGCSATCTSEASCGNGVADVGEDCDDGVNDGSYEGCNADCTLAAYCGDGSVDAGEGEFCDDGVNDGSYEGCNADCTLAAYCGDGSVDAGEGELCDDGVNNGSYGACDADCGFAPYCGDGDVDAADGELCDDAVNDGSYEGCNDDCTLAAYCGDGSVDAGEGEVCDDGTNDGSYGACNADCSFAPYCGDGFVDADEGELCDDAVNDGSYEGCAPDCTLAAYCGDNNVDAGESCDDGANESGDGCSSACITEVPLAGQPSIMTAGSLDDTDPLWSRNNAGCSSVLSGNYFYDAFRTVNSSAVTQYVSITAAWAAGDGFLLVHTEPFDPSAPGLSCVTGDDDFGTSGSQVTELAVESGQVLVVIATTYHQNSAIGSYTITIANHCGDSTIDAYEMCDDGNATSGDGCSSNCLSDETCGNGFVDTDLDETCDDGVIDGAYNGCTPDCLFAAFCGDGSVDDTDGESCDDAGESETCNLDCTAVVCGDGLVNVTAGETCDDGNDVDDGNGCGADCVAYNECNNGVLESLYEECDGTELGGADCVDVGNYLGGVLACSTTCSFDTAACEPNGSGDSCEDVRVITGFPYTISGDDITADFTNDYNLNTNTGCGTAYGAEAVLQTSMLAGEMLLLDEIGNLDSVIRVVDVCDPDALTCLFSEDAGLNEVGLRFTAPADGIYYVVLEAYGASPSSTDYHFTVDHLPAEDCGNGVDDNEDGLVDCAEPHCFGDATYCATEALCGDGEDNDADELVDCADPDCFGDATYCATEALCGDGEDNDADGFTDCADSDCLTGTDCMTQLLFESFDTFPPAGWTIEDGGSNTATWKQCTMADRSFTGHEADPFACADSDRAGVGVDMMEGLVTPSFDCSEFTTVMLAFQQYYRHTSGQLGAVEVSTDGGSNYTPVATYTSNSANGEDVLMDISTEAAGQGDVRVRFYYEGNYDWYWLIDSVGVYAD